jgi:hypothetical protein
VTIKFTPLEEQCDCTAHRLIRELRLAVETAERHEAACSPAGNDHYVLCTCHFCVGRKAVSRAQHDAKCLRTHGIPECMFHALPDCHCDCSRR